MQAVSRAQVATLCPTSLSASEHLYIAVDAFDLPPQNINFHTVMPGFILPWVAGGNFLWSHQNVSCNQGKLRPWTKAWTISNCNHLSRLKIVVLTLDWSSAGQSESYKVLDEFLAAIHQRKLIKQSFYPSLSVGNISQLRKVQCALCQGLLVWADSPSCERLLLRSAGG